MNIFIRDDKGAVLIFGAFFILLIGIALFALSIDLPMTMNKEADAQSLIRSANASAAKKIQFMKFGCGAKEKLRKYDFIYGNDTLITNPMWDMCPGYVSKNDALYSAKLIAFTKHHMRNMLKNKIPERACVNVAGVRQNSNGQPYLYSYIDYPPDSFFSNNQNNSNGKAVCDCTSFARAEGCYRSVSGQMFADESGDLKNYSSKEPWKVFRKGLKTYFVVETSLNTKKNTDFEFIGHILTVIDEVLNYNIGDNKKDTYAGYLTFASAVNPQLYENVYYPNKCMPYPALKVEEWVNYLSKSVVIDLPRHISEDRVDKLNIPTQFGQGHWNAAKHKMRTHLSEIEENDSIKDYSFGVAWCYGIRKAVKDMLQSGCSENHQKCVLNLFVSEPPDYKPDHKLITDKKEGTYKEEQENGDFLECVGPTTPPLNREEQYQCSLQALDYFKDNGGIVIVVGLEGTKVTDPQKFSNWIAKASEDVNNNYLMGNRGMFLPNDESGTVLKVNGQSINVTKADIIQNLLWNYTPRTLEVCQGSSCN